MVVLIVIVIAVVTVVAITRIPRHRVWRVLGRHVEVVL